MTMVMPDCNSGDGFPKLHNNRATLHIHFFNRDTILMVVRAWKMEGTDPFYFSCEVSAAVYDFDMQRRHLWRNSTPMAQYYISPPVR